MVEVSECLGTAGQVGSEPSLPGWELHASEKGESTSTKAGRSNAALST